MEIDTTDLAFLQGLLKKEDYDTYHPHVKDYMCTQLSWEVMESIGSYFKDHPNRSEVDESEYRVWFRITSHPGWKHEKHQMYSAIFDGLFNPSMSPSKTESIRQFAEAMHRNEAARLAEGLKKGTSSWKELQDLLSSRSLGAEEREDLLFSKTLEEIINEMNRFGGLNWRLEDLNLSIGPIRKGDFIIIGKRPETGGTSFICSEFTHMIPQLEEDKHAIIFHNEEDTDKVYKRLLTAALGCTERDLWTDSAGKQAAWLKFLGTKTIDIVSDSSLSTDQIKRYLDRKDYGLIGINVLGKIGITNSRRNLEDHDKLEALGTWARSIALDYGPVLAIVQCDVSAEGVRYPDQSQIYKSKTALQGEADALIMIGRDPDAQYEETRFMHIAKNKLPGSPKTLTNLRHGKFEVGFQPETGRFFSKNFKKGI